MQTRVESFGFELVHLDAEERGLGPGALGEARHGVRDGRLVEHLPESEHGHGFFPREAVLRELHDGPGVDAEIVRFAFVVKRFRHGLDGHLPHVPEVLVPEPPRVHLLELIARARAVRVQLRGLHQRVQVLTELFLGSFQIVLHLDGVLARGRD